ncbi:MAG: hypothetical protein JWO31_710 [Phycisphaerales bacterium]|nr:hypothetical protein [Phycisphaerales bacterium]
MLLPAEQFDAVVAALYPGRTAAAVAGAGTDGGQRRGPRIPVATRLTMIPFVPGAEGLGGYDFPPGPNGSPCLPLAEPVSVPVRDLSRGGLRFLMPRRLPLDTPFVLLMPAAGPVPATGVGPVPVAVECSVSYWQPVRRDLFAIGARFVRALPTFAAPRQPPTILLPGFGEVAGDAAATSARTAG